MPVVRSCAFRWYESRVKFDNCLALFCRFQIFFAIVKQLVDCCLYFEIFKPDYYYLLYFVIIYFSLFSRTIESASQNAFGLYEHIPLPLFMLVQLYTVCPRESDTLRDFSIICVYFHGMKYNFSSTYPHALQTIVWSLIKKYFVKLPRNITLNKCT